MDLRSHLLDLFTPASIGDEVAPDVRLLGASAGLGLRIRALKAAGATTVVVAQPMLPGPLEPLIDALAELADSVSIDVLRGEVAASGDFDAPGYAPSRTEAWQRERALAQGLEARGVPIWHGELPPAVGT